MSMMRQVALVLAALPLGPLMTGCSKGVEDTAAYQAACEGRPLRTLERRNKAAEDGYVINGRYDCIDKASYVFMAEEKARREAANTPQAIAQRQAEREKMIVLEQAHRASSDESLAPAGPSSSFVLRHVDVNTASESELADVPSLDIDVAKQILAEREKRRFSSWADLVHRVVGLGSAQNAAFASVSGLNVDGQSLSGAPPDEAAAAQIHARFHRGAGR